MSEVVCSKCGSNSLRWVTLRRHVPVDVFQCQNCGHPEMEEDWYAPLAPMMAGNCVNCGDRREMDVCRNCGLTREEDLQVHDELRQMVAPTHNLLNAARAASRAGRRLMALKLATAAAYHNEEGQGDRARALRIWLLSAIGEPKYALEDARAWVEQEPDPSALAWASLGQQQKHSGFIGAAAESFHKALQKDPRQHVIRAERARLLIEMQREGQAAEDACIVLESDNPKAVQLALKVAEELCEKFEAGLRDDEVARILERAGDNVEQSAALLAHRARLAALDGDAVSAKRDLKKAHKLNASLPIYERVERLLKPQRSSWWKW